MVWGLCCPGSKCYEILDSVDWTADVLSWEYLSLRTGVILYQTKPRSQALVFRSALGLAPFLISCLTVFTLTSAQKLECGDTCIGIIT